MRKQKRITFRFLIVLTGLLCCFYFQRQEPARTEPITVMAAAKVRLNKTKLSLYVGETKTLTVKGTKKRVKWTSKNTAVASVSSKGKVKAKKAGSVEIRAKAGKKTLVCKVTVNDLPAASVDGKSIRMGQTAGELKSLFGEPDRIDDTVYSYDYYVYHTSDYKNFFMAGIEKGRVVAFYADCSNFTIGVLTPSQPKKEIQDLFGISLDAGTKQAMTTHSGYRYTLFFDTLGSGKLVGALIMEEATDYTKRTSDIVRAEEREIFDCCNSARVRNGLSPLLWSDKAAKAARLHSEDMAKKQYFDHNSLDGTSPFTRMERQGISFTSAGENIIAGYEDAVSSNNGWLNSSGHRSNMLDPSFTYLGVGGSAGKEYPTYFTEDFFS